MSAAPGESSVPLLPFGPGGIESLPPRRACPDEARIPDVRGCVNLLNDFYKLIFHIVYSIVYKSVNCTAVQ